MSKNARRKLKRYGKCIIITPEEQAAQKEARTAEAWALYERYQKGEITFEAFIRDEG